MGETESVPRRVLRHRRQKVGRIGTHPLDALAESPAVQRVCVRQPRLLTTDQRHRPALREFDELRVDVRQLRGQFPARLVVALEVDILDDFPLILVPVGGLDCRDDLGGDVLPGRAGDLVSCQRAAIEANILVRRCLHRLGVMAAAQPSGRFGADGACQLVETDRELLLDAVDEYFDAPGLAGTVIREHHVCPPAAGQRIDDRVRPPFRQHERVAVLGRALGLDVDRVGPAVHELNHQRAVEVVQVPPAILVGRVHPRDQGALFRIPPSPARHVPRLDPTANAERLVLFKVAGGAEVHLGVRLEAERRPEVRLFAPMRLGAHGDKRFRFRVRRGVMQYGAVSITVTVVLVQWQAEFEPVGRHRLWPASLDPRDDQLICLGSAIGQPAQHVSFLCKLRIVRRAIARVRNEDARRPIDTVVA